MHDGRAINGRDHTDLEEIAGMVGADQHGQAFVEILRSDRVVERVEDAVVALAVAAGARRDDRLLHDLQVTLDSDRTQGTLSRSGRGWPVAPLRSLG